VQNMKQLERHRCCGHSVLMAKRKNDWQDTDKVLGMFGEKAGPARRAYRAFVEKGISQGKRSDLTGGGLVRSAGGWTAVKALKRAKIFQKSDDRILGDGDFVERVLASASEAMERKYDLESRGFTMSSLARKLKISVPAVSKSAIRGEKLAKDRKYSLVGKLKLKSFRVFHCNG